MIKIACNPVACEQILLQQIGQMHASKQSENLTTWSGNVRKSRSSIFCFSCTSSCSFVERVKEKMWMVAVAFLIQSIIPGIEDESPPDQEDNDGGDDEDEKKDRYS